MAIHCLVWTMLWLAACLLITSNQGLRDPALLIFACVPGVAGLLLEKRAFAVVTLAAIGCITGLVLTEWAGWITNWPNLTTPIHDLMDIILILVVTALVVGMLNESLRKSLVQARHNAATARSAQERYRALFDRSLDVLYLVDLNGRMLDANPAALNLFGYSASELTTLTIADLVMGEDLPKAKATFEEIRATGTQQELIEFRVRTKSGAVVFVESKASLVFHEGRPFAIQGVCRDITQRKQTDQAVRQRAVFDALVTRILGRFAMSPSEDVASLVQQSLEDAGHFVGVDNVFFYQLEPGGESWRVEHTWFNRELMEPAQVEQLVVAYRIVKAVDMPWFTSTLKANEVVCLPTLEALPPEAQREREAFIRDGAKSRLIVPLVGAGGAVLGAAGYSSYSRLLRWQPQDITCLRLLSETILNAVKRKQAEQALRESERQLRTILEVMPVPVSWADGQGKIHFWNRRATELFGYAPGEITTIEQWWQRAYPEAAYRRSVIAQWDQLTAEAKAKGTAVSAREGNVTCKDGTVRTVEVSGIFFGDRLLVVFVDVTERKQRTMELQNSNRNLLLLNRVLAATQGELEPGGVLQTACCELAEAFDLPLAFAALLGPAGAKPAIVAEHSTLNRASMLSPAGPGLSRPLLLSLLCQETRAVVMEDSALAQEVGPPLEFALTFGLRAFALLPLLDEQQVAGCVVLGSAEPRRFLTEEINLALTVSGQLSRSLALARLGETHRRLLTAIEQTPESIIITDTAAEILYVNPAFEHTSGYRREEVLGRNARLLKSGKHEPGFYRDLWSRVSQGEVWQGTLTNKKKDGLLFSEDVVIAPVRDARGKIINFIAVKRDVTEQKKLEMQLLRMQRVESVGPAGQWSCP